MSSERLWLMFQALMHDFSSQRSFDVAVDFLAWGDARDRLSDYALNKHGPDLSEIGTTWLSNYVSMNALRPFGRSDLQKLGIASPFIDAAWSSTSFAGAQTWAVPWIADTRLMYYRRDWFERAGINPHTAFQSAESMTEAFARLQDAGYDMPWSVVTQEDWIVLHNAASWVWQAGGQFMSADGRRTHFCQPEAIAGFTNYFNTYGPYLAPAAQNLTAQASDALFLQGKVGVTLSGHWLKSLLEEETAYPELQETVGVASPPCVPFVGGSHLIIWNYSQNPELAIELLLFLTSYQVQSTFVRKIGQLSVRTDVWTEDAADPYSQAIGHNLRTGRSFNSTYMWGLVESKLLHVLNMLWRDYFARPGLNIEEAVTKKLVPLSKQLDRTLGSL